MSTESKNQIFWLPKLNELRIQQNYSDITITYDDEKFFCHRVVLAAACNYFHLLFSSDFPDSTSHETSLPEVDKEIFEIILQYIYTGVIELSNQNAFRVLKESDFLGMPKLEEKCMNFIENNNMVENILQICTIANFPLNNSKLAETVVKHAASRLNEIIFSEDFTDISLELLESILDEVHSGVCGYYKCTKCSFFRYASSSEVGNIRCGQCSVILGKYQCDKKNIFPAIIKWIKKDLRQRMTYFPKLSNYADLSSEYVKAWQLLMEDFKYDTQPKSAYEINVFVKTKKNTICPVTWRLATRWVCESNFMMCAKNLRSIISGNSLYFMTFGIDQNDEKTIQFWKKEDNEPVVELQPPPAWITTCELVNANNIIYLYDSSKVFSERYSASSSNSSHQTTQPTNIYAYMAEWNKWFSILSSPQQLYHSYFLSSNGLLYLVGGSTTFSITNKSSRNILQIYNPKSSVWSQFLTDVEFTLKGAACVCDEKIYICEEFVNTATRNSVAVTIHVFDIITNKWQKLNVAKEIEFVPRGLIPFNNQLWVFPDQPMYAIKVYDLKMKCWSEIAPIPSEFATKEVEKTEIEGIEDVVIYQI